MLEHPSGQALPEAIQNLHEAIAEHPDPQAKQDMTKALQLLLTVQTRDMQQPAAQPINPLAAALGR